MTEITSVTLETEMDLILANKQCVRLGELTGLMLSQQTTFATAVSEICRCAIDRSAASMLMLYINSATEKHRYIIAVIRSGKEFITAHSDGFLHARKLLPNVFINIAPGETTVELRTRIYQSKNIDELGITKMRIQLNSDPVISPYEEIKRRNRQLLELADKLSASEHQYRMLAETLPLHIYTVDANGQLLFANKWLTEFTGKTMAELNATSWQDILHPDDIAAYRDIWPREDRKNINTELRIRNRHGIYKWHTGTAIFIPADKEELSTWNVYMVDIDAQKMVEQTLKDNLELKQTQKKLEDNIRNLNENNRQLEQFAYVASHDLQEPLRKISFYSDYLNARFGDKLGENGNAVCTHIINAANRMKGLIHDILSYSTINADSRIMQPVDLGALADEAIQDLSIAIAAKNAGISHLDLPVIDGHPGQLKQLFANLISNSVKYVADGVTPRISISAQIKGNTVQILFADNGIGFDPIFLDKMFSLFQRLHSRDKYAGTGIGLAICKKIVNLHHGTISATSKPGQGSTFIIHLPILQAKEKTEQDA